MMDNQVGRASAFPPPLPPQNNAVASKYSSLGGWEITVRIHVFLLCGVTMEILFRWENSEVNENRAKSGDIFHDMRLWCNLRFD